MFLPRPFWIPYPPGDACDVFAWSSIGMWELLELSHHVGSTLGEETLTELLLHSIKVANLSNIHIFLSNKPRESRTGFDFELWVGSSARRRWRGYAIQAKVISSRGKYEHLQHTVQSTGARQIDLLRAYASARQVEPVYLFYNHVSTSILNLARLHECGCSVVNASTIHALYGSKQDHTFDYFHQGGFAAPWQTLVCDLWAQSQRVGISSPLFHPAPPRALPSDIAALLAASNVAAASDTPDPDQDADQQQPLDTNAPALAYSPGFTVVVDVA